MIRKSPEEATILLWIAFILIDQIYDYRTAPQMWKRSDQKRTPKIGLLILLIQYIYVVGR
jgi:hypothetical protein